MKQQVTFPLPQVVSINSFYNMHWARRKELKDDLRMYTLLIFQENLVPVQKFPVILDWTFSFKRRKFDIINCAAMAKILEDLLVEHKILPNDTHKYVCEHRLRVSDEKPQANVKIALTISDKI